jgi:hypothetical protein
MYHQCLTYKFFLSTCNTPYQALSGYDAVCYFYEKMKELHLDDPNRALTLGEKLTFQGGELFIFQAARKTGEDCLR